MHSAMQAAAAAAACLLSHHQSLAPALIRCELAHDCLGRADQPDPLPRRVIHRPGLVPPEGCPPVQLVHLRLPVAEGRHHNNPGGGGGQKSAAAGLYGPPLPPPFPPTPTYPSALWGCASESLLATAWCPWSPSRPPFTCTHQSVPSRSKAISLGKCPWPASTMLLLTGWCGFLAAAGGAGPRRRRK